MITKAHLPIRSRKLFLVPILLALLLFGVPRLHAQRPTFQKWNAGASVGANPLNAFTALPTLRGYYKNFGVELSPYAFSPGAALSYQFPLRIAQKAYFSLDAKMFAAHQNGLYVVNFPFQKTLRDRNDVGLMAGFSAYFLKRCNLQALIGTSLYKYYGEDEFLFWTYDSPQFQTKASLTLEVKLFKSFAE